MARAAGVHKSQAKRSSEWSRRGGSQETLRAQCAAYSIAEALGIPLGLDLGEGMQSAADRQRNIVVIGCPGTLHGIAQRLS